MTSSVDDALGLWDLPGDARTRLINVAENHTYLVESGSGPVSVLRVHRHGYHSRQSIESEIHWLLALAGTGDVRVPSVIPGRDGNFVQLTEFAGTGSWRHMVMFSHVDGTAPDPSGDLVAGYRELGRISVRLHRQSAGWPLPIGFSRPAWNTRSLLGPGRRWGNWRHAPNVTPEICQILERAEAKVIGRLANFGMDRKRYGLIHADMRLANLIMADDGIWVIDFDDCGPGWHLYDFAAGISFIEDHPQVADYRAAWIEGYCESGYLGREERDEIDSFVMLRRLALLAWVGSRIDATEPRQLAPHFAAVSAKIAEKFLAKPD